MAKRYVYQATTHPGLLVEKVEIEFQWYPGFAPSQKQKSIEALHAAYSSESDFKVLEVSSKSLEQIGIDLSAFNLSTEINGKSTSVESLFQGSKVFEDGQNYADLYLVSSLEAKRDPRIKNSGNVTGFNFFDRRFPTHPATFFYDWLYINTLIKNPELYEQIIDYNAFTDIEFNPKKQINCQAYSLALFVSFYRRGFIVPDKSFTQEEFKELIKVESQETEQLDLLG